MNKKTIKKYLNAISNSNKKVYTVFDLSEDTGEKIDFIQNNLVDYNVLVNFKLDFDLHEIVSDLEADLSEKNIKKSNKSKRLSSKEVAKYHKLIDYIYDKMTVPGGVIDLGYKLTKTDIKIIKKLIKIEEKNLD